MNADLERLVRAHAARLAADAEERDAIIAALRNRSVPQAEIARITGVSTETVRQLRKAAGIPPDERKIRGIRGIARGATLHSAAEDWLTGEAETDG
jgi:Sigma-70, region 4